MTIRQKKIGINKKFSLFERSDMKNLVFGSCVFLMVGCSAMVGTPPIDGDNLDKESLKFTPEEANERALKIVSHICEDGKKAEVWNAHYIGREFKFNFKCV